MEEEKKGAKPANNELDIVWLIKYMFARWKWIAKVVCIVTVLAIVKCLVTSKTFTCKAGIMPLTSSSSGLGGLSSMAALAGIDASSLLGGKGQNSQITPDLFSNIASSTPAMLYLMNRPMTWTDPDTVMTALELSEYKDEHPTIGGTILKYTLGLPGTILGALNPPPEVEASLGNGEGTDEDDIKPIILDRDMQSCAKDFGSRINVEMDEEVNIVWVTCEAENATQSAELTTAVLEYIQKMCTDFVTQNARKNLYFAEKQFNLAMDDLADKREKWFRYKDSHRYAVEERGSIESSELYENYNLAYNLMTNLQQQVAAYRLEVANQTPAFSVVEPVVTPLKKSSPRMSYHLVGGVILGGVVAVGYLLVVLGFKQVFKPKEFEEIYAQYAEEEEKQE